MEVCFIAGYCIIPKPLLQVIAATNRADILDPALMRSGRLDRKIEFPHPTEDARAKILQIHSRKMNVSPDVNFEELARSTDDFNAAQLKAVCVEAGMLALRRDATEVELFATDPHLSCCTWAHGAWAHGIPAVQGHKYMTSIRSTKIESASLPVFYLSTVQQKQNVLGLQRLRCIGDARGMAASCSMLIAAAACGMLNTPYDSIPLPSLFPPTGMDSRRRQAEGTVQALSWISHMSAGQS